MNYLSGAETQANVAVLWVVSRWLKFVGKSPFADLSSALRPPSLVPGADNAFRASLAVGRHMGVLESTDEFGIYQLGPRLPENAVADHRSFRRAVREALLAQAVDDAAAGRQPTDVAVGFTWLCSLDPIRPLAWSWNDVTERAVQHAGLGQVINNSAQWGAFRRWAVSLGIATSNNPRGSAVQVLVPDPCRAIEETLPQIAARTTGPVFLESLAHHLPVIDTGVLERVARDLGVSYSARSDATIGPVLAHALRRLHHREVLSLNKAADASHRVSYRTSTGTSAFDDVAISGARS